MIPYVAGVRASDPPRGAGRAPHVMSPPVVSRDCPSLPPLVEVAMIRPALRLKLMGAEVAVDEALVPLLLLGGCRYDSLGRRALWPCLPSAIATRAPTDAVQRWQRGSMGQ